MASKNLVLRVEVEGSTGKKYVVSMRADVEIGIRGWNKKIRSCGFVINSFYFDPCLQ